MSTYGDDDPNKPLKETAIVDTDTGARPRQNVDPDHGLKPLLGKNHFAVREAASKTLINVALMEANISQLKILLDGDPAHRKYHDVLLSLIVLSLVVQVIFAFIVALVCFREKNQSKHKDYIKGLRKKTALITDDSKKMRLEYKLSYEEEKYCKNHNVTKWLNYFSAALVFIITVSNMFITGLGMAGYKVSENAGPAGESNNAASGEPNIPYRVVPNRGNSTRQ